MKRAKGLRCYVCGKPVFKQTNDIGFLVSLTKSTDRVFIICDRNSHTCLNQIENGFMVEVVENGTRIIGRD